MNTLDEELRQYCDAIRGGEAGFVELDPADDPVEVEVHLRDAARLLGYSILAGWIGAGQQLLAWRRWDGPVQGVHLIGIAPRAEVGSPVQEGGG